MISILLPLWFACTDTEKADDADGDGIPTLEDCNDEDPSIGTAQTWYADADGDVFGDENTAQESCTPILCYVLYSGD